MTTNRFRWSRLSRWILLGALVGVCIWGIVRMVNTAWFVRIGNPVTGSFRAGPVNQFFSAGQTIVADNVTVARIDLKISRDGPNDAATAFFEVRDACAPILGVRARCDGALGSAGRSLRSGSVRLRRGTTWYSLTFPPIGLAEFGEALFVEVRSAPKPVLSDRDLVSVFYEQHDHHTGGRMYIRGEPSRPDWDLAFRAYRAAGLREVMKGIGRWPLLGVEAPWLIGVGGCLAAGAVGWMVWCCGRGDTGRSWAFVFVALMLLALAMHLPEIVANPQIDTATVELR